MGDKTAAIAGGGYPDEGGDSDVWAALTLDGPPADCGGQPAECTVRRKLLAQITRGLDAARATQLVAVLSPLARTEMLSAGGPDCGSTWTTVPTHQERRLVNSEFVAATQQRLGSLARPPSALACQIRGSDGTACGALLDGGMRHADVCPYGYIRVHKAMVAAVVNEATRAGADADIERYVPELIHQKDVGMLEDAKLDAVVRCPRADPAS